MIATARHRDWEITVLLPATSLRVCVPASRLPDESQSHLTCQGEAVRHLTDVDSGLVRLHGQLVTAAARASPSALNLVLHAYVAPAASQ